MITTIKNKTGTTVLRDYREYAIASYDNRQLGDETAHGRSYSIYRNREAYTAGDDALNATIMCLDYLWEAKKFVDALCK
jgi:hypothetical protein